MDSRAFSNTLLVQRSQETPPPRVAWPVLVSGAHKPGFCVPLLLRVQPSAELGRLCLGAQQGKKGKGEKAAVSELHPVPGPMGDWMATADWPGWHPAFSLVLWPQSETTEASEEAERGCTGSRPSWPLSVLHGDPLWAVSVATSSGFLKTLLREGPGVNSASFLTRTECEMT